MTQPLTHAAQGFLLDLCCPAEQGGLSEAQDSAQSQVLSEPLLEWGVPDINFCLQLLEGTFKLRPGDQMTAEDVSLGK